MNRLRKGRRCEEKPVSHYLRRSFEMRYEAIRLHLEEGLDVHEIAARLQTPSPSCMYCWIKAYEKGGAAAIMPKTEHDVAPAIKDDRLDTAAKDDLLRRARDLELENDVLKATIATLKKTAALTHRLSIIRRNP